MEYMVRIEMNTTRNFALHHAAKFNNKDLAAKLLRMGVDVNGLDYEYVFEHTENSKLFNPLQVAAHYGHESMVLLLLDAGASQLMRGSGAIGEGQPYPLFAAIENSHENVARILLKDIKQWKYKHGNWFRSWTEGEAILLMSCQAGLVELSRELIERIHVGETHEQAIETRTLILQEVLNETAAWSRGYKITADIVERKLLPKVYPIVLLLLEYGADPDREIDFDWDEWIYQPHRQDDDEGPPGSIRISAQYNPDPRIRHRLLKARTTTMPRPEPSSLQIGHNIKYPWEVTHTFNKDLGEQAYIHNGSCSLWNFLDESERIASSLDPEDHNEMALLEYTYEAKTRSTKQIRDEELVLDSNYIRRVEEEERVSSEQHVFRTSAVSPEDTAALKRSTFRPPTSTEGDVLLDEFLSINPKSQARSQAGDFWSKLSRDGFWSGKRVDGYGDEF